MSTISGQTSRSSPPALALPPAQQRQRRPGRESAEAQRDRRGQADHDRHHEDEHAEPDAGRDDLAWGHRLDAGLRDQVGQLDPPARLGLPCAAGLLTSRRARSAAARARSSSPMTRPIRRARVAQAAADRSKPAAVNRSWCGGQPSARTSRPSLVVKMSAVSTTSPSTLPGTATISRSLRCPWCVAADVDDQVDAGRDGRHDEAVADVLAGQQRQRAHLGDRLAGRVGVDACTCRASPQFSAMSRSRHSSWRTSPTMIRSGRIRSASLTSRRSRTSPVPSRLACRVCIDTTSGSRHLELEDLLAGDDPLARRDRSRRGSSAGWSCPPGCRRRR